MSRRARSSRNALRASRLLLVFTAVAALVVGVLVPSTTASASTGAVESRDVKTTLVGFNPGNIISDTVFTNKGTMTEAQIQTFFNSKVPKCLGGVDKYGPIICLKDYRISSVDRPADKYCAGYTGAANESAARIIHRVAQSCGINPQVLIVMLQKEQGLVTHTWPSAPRYSAALGQGCPDGGVPCDPNYVGFFHQIYGAARQMQIYMEGRWFTYYGPGKTWNIRYNPEIACGSAPVYVANKATSALYYYTPYQPNAAALRAGYGEGDACSAYGNRNFYNYFTDWFGSTQVPSGPSLASVSMSTYVTGVDSAGVMWGYPFAKGAWGERKQLATGLAGVTGVIHAGDLTGTGQRDVILRQGAKVSVMRGSATGFSSAQALAVDWTGVVLATAGGDVDGDGVPDVLTTMSNGDLSLWRGDDRGGLLPAVRIGWGWAGMGQLVGGIDLNRDGNPDLVARDTAGRLWAFYGNGAGGWLSQTQIGQGWGGMSSVFSAGDFNGDGAADILARSSAGDIWLYPGTGTGGITSHGQIGYGWSSLSSLSGTGAPVVTPRALPAGAGDVDGDGASDVLALTAQGALLAYRGNDAGGWRGSKQIGTGWAAGDRMLNLGDFNGDGRRDLGRVTAGGAFLMYPGLPGGGYGQPATIGNGWQSLGLLVGGMDYDGDRRPDVLGRDGSGALLLYRGNGKGGWAAAGTAIGFGWGALDLAFNVGDFDGDGRGDLVARAADGNLFLYPTNGGGGWGTPRKIGNGWSGFTSVFGVGDFDGSGAVDVMARSSSGALHLYRGNGSGGWSGSAAIGSGWGGFAALG